MLKTIPLARHIFTRLHQLNCKTLHGVPGDFFLRALDHLPPSKVSWIGNANELCAGYAADGYARATLTGLSRSGRSPVGTVGALLTTYGVGELSAINAVGGAYSESVPLVHLVSTPSRQAMRTGMDRRRLVHHSLPGRRLDVFAEMARAVTCAQGEVFRYQDAGEAAERVDEVLETAVKESLPVYVGVGVDQWEVDVPAEIGERELDVRPPGNDVRVQREVMQEVWRLLTQARQPLIIADALCWAYDLQKEVDEVVRLTGVPSMCYTSGKGVIEEQREGFSGALPNTTEYSRQADVVMIFGPLLSDTNTARWSAIPDAETTVLFDLDSIEIVKAGGEKTWKGVRVKEMLGTLIEKIKNNQTKLRNHADAYIANRPQPMARTSPSPMDPIKQDDLWPHLSSFLRPDDTVLLANGTPLIGARSITLPPQTHVLASALWNAIGSLLPAAQGIAAAKRDHNLSGRTILLEGDGSLQVTIQALSDIIRYQLDVTIIIANNGGYTYERWLHGMDAAFNDVPAWRYSEAARFFGAEAEYPVFSRRVERWGDLVEALEDERMRDGRGLKILDVVMGAKDVPEGSKAGLLRAAESLKPGPG